MSIAKNQARAGDLRGAMRTAACIADHQSKVSTLIDIAIAQADKGNRGDARRTIAQAYKIATTVRGKRRVWLLADLSAAQARAGDIPGALRTAGAIRGQAEEAPFRKIAVSLAQAGDFRRAIDIAKGMSESYLKALSLTEIALAQAKGGHRGPALATCRLAYECTAPLRDQSDRDTILRHIVSAQAEAGSITGALRTVARIEKAHERDNGIDAIAMAYARAGEAKRALRTAMRVRDLEDRTGVIGGIAVVLARAGNHISAETAFGRVRLICRRLRDAASKASCFHDLAWDLADARYFREALGSASTIAQPEERTSALCLVAVAQANAGEIQWALETLAPLADDEYKASALGYIAVARAKAGNVRAALEWARGKNPPLARSKALLKLAEGLLEHAGGPGVQEQRTGMVVHFFLP